MSIISSILGGGATNLIDSIGNAINKNVTNDAERMALSNDLQKILQENDSEITKRLAADMASDSWLSKNIRPMVLIFILLIYSTFSVLDGNISGFKISSNYIELLGQWGMLIMSFYFGSRGLEKIAQILKK